MPGGILWFHSDLPRRVKAGSEAWIYGSPRRGRTLKSGSVVGLDGDAGIDRKPTPVSPLAHVFGCLGAEKAIALEQAQRPAPHEALNSGDVALAEHGGGMEPQFPGRAQADDAVDDTDVEGQMRSQRRAESLARVVPTILLHSRHPWRSDEGDRPEARPRRGARRALA